MSVRVYASGVYVCVACRCAAQASVRVLRRAVRCNTGCGAYVYTMYACMCVSRTTVQCMCGRMYNVCMASYECSSGAADSVFDNYDAVCIGFEIRVSADRQKPSLFGAMRLLV